MVETASNLLGKLILVVEDEYALATDLADFLADQGAVVLSPAGSVKAASSLVAREGAQLSVAVLDINLHGLKSYPIADVLKARNIPFVFTTGYSGEAIPDAYRAYPRCERPFNQNVLIAALAGARQQRRSA